MKIYILEVDNNLAYEDNNVNTLYFDSYEAAWEHANDIIYYNEFYSERPNNYDYRIFAIEINGTQHKSDLRSAWSYDTCEWVHADEMWMDEYPYYYTTLQLIERNCIDPHQLNKDACDAWIHNCLGRYNDEIMAEAEKLKELGF